MSTKLLFVGDVHLADRAPSSRADDYFTTVMGKLKEILKEAEDRKVDAVIFLGDLFHYKKPNHTSHRVANSLTNVLRKCHLPCYTIVGNHDVEGGNLETILSQPIGNALISGYLKILPKDLNINGVWLHGHNHSYSEDNPFISEIATSQRDMSQFHIDVTHAPIITKNQKPFPGVVLVDNLWGLPFDLLVNGHIHTDMGSVKSPSGSQEFINYGSITRGVLSEDNINRLPRVAFVTIEGKSYSVEPYTIKCALPGEVVFKVEQHVRKYNATAKFESFMNFMGQMLDVDKSKTIDATLNEFFAKVHVEKELENRVRHYLEKTVE